MVRGRIDMKRRERGKGEKCQICRKSQRCAERVRDAQKESQKV